MGHPLYIRVKANLGLYAYTQQLQNSGVTGSTNTTESISALHTEFQLEEAITFGGGDPGRDYTTKKTSEPASENGTSTASVVSLLPMEMTSNKDEAQGIGLALSPQDNVAYDTDPYNQVRSYTLTTQVG